MREETPMEVSVNFSKPGKWIEYLLDLMIYLVELSQLQPKGMQMSYKGSYLIYFLETYGGSGSRGDRYHKSWAYSLVK